MECIDDEVRVVGVEEQPIVGSHLKQAPESFCVELPAVLNSGSMDFEERYVIMGKNEIFDSAHNRYQRYEGN